jgi:hypothetical protein
LGMDGASAIFVKLTQRDICFCLQNTECPEFYYRLGLWVF